jgi:hypothetical protein
MTVPCFLDFSAALAGRERMGLGLGPALDVWVLALDGVPDTRQEIPGLGSMAKSQADRPQSYEVLRFTGSGTPPERLRLPPQRRSFHYVQPLPDGALLLAGARCDYVAKGQHERNAVVYGGDGTPLRELTLGDGIQDVQATADGRLWVSYFDEGVIGNHGWGRGNPDTLPLGQDGLVLYDATGRRLASYDAKAAGTDIIVDCYALNVASERDTWVYFYSKFPLVRLRDAAAPTVWETGLRGATALAVSDTHVLFAGGYRDQASVFQLFPLHDGGTRRLGKPRAFRFQDEAGPPWKPTWMCGRGPWLYGCEGTRLFRIHLDSLVASATHGH